ncbi:hypothetical protein [Gudongella sp. DL1XJH-153]|uniref:hypothetical protein n=1 Tax=Gudongella sp. DL1XJH-153 TaxID=3409804 RepID=UPI003BB4A3F5
MRKPQSIGLVIFVVLAIGIMLPGCTAVEEKPEPSEIPVETVEEPDEAPSEFVEEASEEAKELCNIDNSEKALMKQLAFIHEGNTITLGDIVDEDKMELLFGVATDTKTHTYSKDDGRNMDQLIGLTEKEYSYEGLVIKTIEAKDSVEPFIFSVEITDSRYQALRKVKVGDSYEVLRESYPEGVLLGGELTDQEDDYRYEPFDYVNVMTFHIKNRMVESITMNRLLD